MRFERSSVLAFFSSAFVALLTVSNTGAALLFQDRHTGANGEETIYRFEANAASTTSPIEQSKAVKAATVWATQYYGIGNLTVANVQERSMPVHFWLIAFTAPGQSKGWNLLLDCVAGWRRDRAKGFASKPDRNRESDRCH